MYGCRKRPDFTGLVYTVRQTEESGEIIKISTETYV